MSRIPRASLCITLLDDEDYRVLMATKGGLEAFGFFAALLVVGRERFQQGKARQLSESNLLHPSVSNSLIFDNSPTHILAMTHTSSKQMERCLNVFWEVAEATGGKPWVYIDQASHLVIRSFFKFNTSTGWGGNRPGAGRKSRRNQDDSDGNQVDTESKSSRIYSGTGTGITSDDGAHAHVRGAAETPPSSSPSSSNGIVELFTLNPDHATLIEAARSAFGDQFADTVAEMGRDIQDTLSGRWDCYAAAIKWAKRSIKPIDNLHLYCLKTGEKFTRNGVPPEPVASKPTNGHPAEPPVHRAPADSPHRNRTSKPSTEPTS